MHPFTASLIFSLRPRVTLGANRRALIGSDDFGNPRGLVDAVLLTKSLEWAYEGEYRILARAEDADPALSLPTAKDYLQLTPGALTGIIAGSKAYVGPVEVVSASGCMRPAFSQSDQCTDRA
jgi:hypothetical protein